MAPVHGNISAAPVAPPPDLKVFRPQNPYVALGLAANHLMTKPAFAKLRFGDWSRILVGQINRKHYCFAVDSTNQVQGFMGWAVTSKERAEAWVEGRGAFSFADSLDGDCVVFNAWAANTGKVNRFLLGEARKVIAGKDTVYFKRFYKDGSVRPARLRVNDFVAQHLGRKNGDGASGFFILSQSGDRPERLREPSRLDTMPVTAITESSKHHRSVNPLTLQPRPIIGGERHGGQNGGPGFF